MEDQIKFLDRKTYDELCDQVRHVVSDMKRYDTFLDNVDAIIFELSKIVKSRRKELTERVQRLEELIDKVLCKVSKDG